MLMMLLCYPHSDNGLRKSLLAIEKYASKWQLVINIKKTKILIFNSIYKNKPTFTIYDTEIEICKSFCYLGITISDTGSFKLGIKRLKDKAAKAYMAWRRNINIKNNASVKTVLKLFDSLCKPILLYCSEVWGAFENIWNKKSIKYFLWYDKYIFENFHKKFCKYSLGIGKNASNIASLAELGRFPLSLTIVINIIKYYFHINRCNENSLVKTAFYNQISLYHITVKSNKIISGQLFIQYLMI